jgi:hypothetical protein
MRALVSRPGKKSSSTSARRAGSIIIAAGREATSFRRRERRGPERHDWPQLGMLCERHQQISKPTLAKLSVRSARSPVVIVRTLTERRNTPGTAMPDRSATLAALPAYTSPHGASLSCRAAGVSCG